MALSGPGPIAVSFASGQSGTYNDPWRIESGCLVITVDDETQQHGRTRAFPLSTIVNIQYDIDDVAEAPETK